WIRVHRVPWMSTAATSAASTTTSSPQIHRYAAIVPSASDDALPSALSGAPSATEYGPLARATGAMFVEGGGGGSDGEPGSVDGSPISTPATAAFTVPMSAPGIVPLCPAP